ncbi:YtxH domain-containing protein [Coprothermobacteraceae bacterium]|nr:YtxH domain-containing protein [Coprothermobacteraceae bacterium]
MEDVKKLFCVFSAFVAGVVVGAAAGLFLAPMKGEELQEITKEKALELKEAALKKAEELKKKAEELSKKAEEIVSEPAIEIDQEP